MTDPVRTLLGIDYGTRRIGLACGDSERRIAFAVGVHDEGRDGSVFRYLRLLVEQRHIDAFVVGMPLRADGGEGEIAARARRFADRLEAEFGLPCIFWDERYSSQEADRWLGSGRGRDKGERDALAAEIILQSYLDSLAGGATAPEVGP